ncbi:Uma2 family endonuclease [Pendulispora brunnea]|uniref:Uma2 family endonuclease n=1 Tax=Pendulispora brunnea TaxID=2905690 RepID=A0ABZ2KFD7_9BACT
MDPRKPITPLEAPGVRSESVHVPRIDERLAPPETRLEYLHGIELFAAPVDPPHATRHADVTAVLRTAVADGYIAAVDLLTRTEDASDFAPHASIYPADLDGEGHRRLEELAFEIASEQSLSVPTNKARELIRRGVRRVFCVLVKQSRVLEWSREADSWQTLLLDSVIEDRCFVVPIKVRALLEAAAADDAVGSALLEKKNPVVVSALTNSKTEGVLEAKASALVTVLGARGIALDDAARARIGAERNLEVLDRWIVRAATATSLDEVLG